MPALNWLRGELIAVVSGEHEGTGDLEETLRGN